MAEGLIRPTTQAEVMELYHNLVSQMPSDQSDNTTRLMLAALALMVATIIKRRFSRVQWGVELAKFENLVKDVIKTERQT